MTEQIAQTEQRFDDEEVAQILASRTTGISIGGVTIYIAYDTEWTRPAGNNSDHVERGTIAYLPNVVQSGFDNDNPPIGTYWNNTWHGRPTRIYGIPDYDLGTALNELLDVGIAYLTQREMTDALNRKEVDALDALRRNVLAASGLPTDADMFPLMYALMRAHGSPAMWDAVKAASERLRSGVEAAIRRGRLQADDIMSAAGIDDKTYWQYVADVNQLEAEQEEQEFYNGLPADPNEGKYLGVAEVAARLGVSEGTVRGYKSRQYLPSDRQNPEDLRQPQWLPATIELFLSTRAGQGVGGGPKAIRALPPLPDRGLRWWECRWCGKGQENLKVDVEEKERRRLEHEAVCDWKLL